MDVAQRGDSGLRYFTFYIEVKNDYRIPLDVKFIPLWKFSTLAFIYLQVTYYDAR
jgi:hypothetical protein